jgi:hypothetical protein
MSYFETQTGQSVFDLVPGQRVYDTMTNKYGRISKIEETKPEVIEAFVKWDDNKEEIMSYLPNYKIVSE